MTRTGAWALVVGIDAYDDPRIRRLDGAVADACSVVQWLRKTGVPDVQILLHLSPTDASRPVAEGVGISFRSAREPEIWDSIFTRLRRVVDGEWLLVYLAGHGLYDPATQRLFLTQEATEGAHMNLGIERYSEYFRSMSFGDQFLLMDGCLNYPYAESQRPTIEAAMHASVTGYTPRPQNGWAAAFAASQDQRAFEINGGGLFTREFLRVADLVSPDLEATTLDFATGRRAIDLGLTMQRVTPIVEAQAREMSPPQLQTPQIERRGRFANAGNLPLIEMEDVPVSKIRIGVRPGEVTPNLERFRIAVDDPPYWDRRLPTPPERSIDTPISAAVPSGLSVSIVAELAQGCGWLDERVEQRFTVSGDREVTLEYRRGEPGENANRHEVEVIPAGPSADESPEFDIRDIGPYRRGHDVTVERTRRGRSVTFDRASSEWAGPVTERVAQRAQQRAEPSTSVQIRMPEAVAAKDNIRLVLPRGGARRLAGPLVGAPAVRVGPNAAEAAPAWRDPQALTLAALAQQSLLSVDPGPLTVSLELPWGSWRDRLRAPATGTRKVRLPTSVGTPPLRVPLVREAGRTDVALLGLGRRPASVELATPDQAVRFIRARKGDADWALRPAHGESAERGLYRIGFGRRRYRFPAHHGPLAIAVGPNWIRIEPLSTAPEPLWDLLVTTGRLDALSPDDLVALSRRKWVDPLLGVASAYGLYAARSWDYLDEVLNNLRGLTSVPDVELLGAAADREMGGPVLPPATVLEHPPVFRWGLQVRNSLLPEGDQDPHSRTMSVGLSPLSVWTVWQEPAAPPPQA